MIGSSLRRDSPRRTARRAIPRASSQWVSNKPSRGLPDDSQSVVGSQTEGCRREGFVQFILSIIHSTLDNLLTATRHRVNVLIVHPTTLPVSLLVGWIGRCPPGGAAWRGRSSGWTGYFDHLVAPPGVIQNVGASYSCHRRVAHVRGPASLQVLESSAHHSADPNLVEKSPHHGQRIAQALPSRPDDSAWGGNVR